VSIINNSKAENTTMMEVNSGQIVIIIIMRNFLKWPK